MYFHFMVIFLSQCLLLSHFSCVRLCVTPEGSPPGSPIPGILQARTLEWVAISFSNAGKWKVKVKSLSRARPSATPWTAAFQAPPSMGFSRQEYWSGVPLPSPKQALDIPNTLDSQSELLIHAELFFFFKPKWHNPLCSLDGLVLCTNSNMDQTLAFYAFNWGYRDE